jgi:recombinational DNA repair protein RecT
MEKSKIKNTHNIEIEIGESVEKEEKELLTFYFPVGLVDQFDEFIYHTKKQIRVNKRKKLSRTALAHIILQDVFDEYAKFGNKSHLWKVFSKWIEE